MFISYTIGYARILADASISKHWGPSEIWTHTTFKYCTVPGDWKSISNNENNEIKYKPLLILNQTTQYNFLGIQ